MKRRPPRSTRTDTLFPYTTLFRSLKAEMTDAVWIGGRRWDIRFRSGETLALPEGDAAAIRALKLFAKLDGAQGLLKRGFVRFDMPLPDKMVIRVTAEPGRQARSGERRGGKEWGRTCRTGWWPS